MTKVICSRCMEVFDEDGDRCPRCDAGSPHAYDFGNSDDYVNYPPLK